MKRPLTEDQLPDYIPPEERAAAKEHDDEVYRQSVIAAEVLADDQRIALSDVGDGMPTFPNPPVPGQPPVIPPPPPPPGNQEPEDRLNGVER